MYTFYQIIKFDGLLDEFFVRLLYMIFLVFVF
jgi:hypothetical protein